MTDLLQRFSSDALPGHANRPRKSEAGLLDNPNWSAFYFWRNGEPVHENLERAR